MIMYILYYAFVILLIDIPYGVNSEIIRSRTGPWTSLYYGWDYWPICQNYTLRDHISFDFVLCEGVKGWASPHVSIPFLTTIFTGNAFAAWFIQIFFEAVIELGFLIIFGDFGLFPTTDVERETITGILWGDWIIGATLGVIPAYFLLRLLKYDGFSPRYFPTTRRYIEGDEKTIKYNTGSKKDAIMFFEYDNRTVLTEISKKKYYDYWIARWKVFFMWFVIVIIHIAIQVVDPDDCLTNNPPNCRNIGLLVITCILPFVLLFVWYVYFGISKFDQKYIKRGLSKSKWFSLWLITSLFGVSINIQGVRPYFPLFLGPAGATTQVWLVALIWILVLGIYWWVWEWRLILYAGSIKWNAFERLIKRYLCCCCFREYNRRNKKDRSVV